MSNIKIRIRYYLHHCVVDGIFDLFTYLRRLLFQRGGASYDSLVDTDDTEDTLSVKEGLRSGLEDALAGRTYPIETLWENVYADEPPPKCKD